MNSLVIGLIVATLALLTLVLAIQYLRQRSDVCEVLEVVSLPAGRRVQIVDEGCQEGLPHTTDGRTIRMTRGAWESTRRDEILRHEHVHCDQKSSPTEWHKFYMTAWEYELLSTPPASIPASLCAKLRPNPDTADAPWAVWRNRWVFFPVSAGVGDDGLLRLRDARVAVWDLKSATLLSGPPPEWRVEFCEGPDGSVCPAQYEHPHELSAEFLTSRSSTAPAAQKLFAWRK